MTTRNIAELQNDEPSINLLRARSQLFLEASQIQRAQFVLTVVIPLALAISGLVLEPVRAYAAIAALIITVADVTWMDRKFRKKFAAAARVCERFDCDLFGLKWKPMVAGKQVDPEEVSRAANDWSGGDEKLLNWYPIAVGRAPIEIARFVCQRTNLWYDGALRRGYANALFYGSGIVLVAALLVAAVFQLDIVSLTLFLVPVAPLLIWAIREGLRQQDAATANESLRSEVEVTIDAIANGNIPPDSSARARDIQDGIFQRRVGTSPMLLSQLYDWRRARMEHQMNEGAEDFIRRLGF